MFEGCVDIFRPFDREGLQCNACGSRRCFRRMELSGTDCCISKDRQSRNCGYRFSEKFDLFPSQLRKIEEYPSEIPSRTSEVLSPSAGYGIVFQADANDWNHVGSFHRSPNRIRTAGKNDVAVEGDQLAGKFVVTFEGAAGIAGLQHSVLAIEIPGFA